MVDIAESRMSEWFQVTENVESWENQIKKLKEELSELADDELVFDFAKLHKEEEVFNKL